MTDDKVAADPSVTLVLNNAVFFTVGTVADTSRETLTGMIALNITALSALTIAVPPRFQERKSGTIINVGSVSGVSPVSFVPIYGPTEAYVLNFTQILQQQLAATDIRVQLLMPAATVSEGWEVAGMSLSSIDPSTVMSTEDCVDAALRGLDAGEAITLPSLHDDSLLRNYEEASSALINATASDHPAPRYSLTR